MVWMNDFRKIRSQKFNFKNLKYKHQVTGLRNSGGKLFEVQKTALLWMARHLYNFSGTQFQPRTRSNNGGLSKHGTASKAGQCQVGRRKAVLLPAQPTAALSIAGCYPVIFLTLN